MLADGDGEELYGLAGRMLCWLAYRDRGDLPHCREKIAGDPVRLMWSYPAKEAWLMLPGVPGPCEDGPILGPDDLLMHEGSVLVPGSLYHGLSPAGVPAVPGGVGRDRFVDSYATELLVKLGIRGGVVPVTVRPVLILAFVLLAARF